MGFWADIRRDFKADCEKYGKPWIYFFVLGPVCGVLLMVVYTIWGDVISRTVWGPLEGVLAGWVGAAEEVPSPYRGPCYFVSVVSLLTVGSIASIVHKSLGKMQSYRPGTALRGVVAVFGMIAVYGLFAVAVLCIDPAGDRFFVFGQAVLSFAAFIYATICVTAAPIFE